MAAKIRWGRSAEQGCRGELLPCGCRYEAGRGFPESHLLAVDKWSCPVAVLARGMQRESCAACLGGGKWVVEWQCSAVAETIREEALRDCASVLTSHSTQAHKILHGQPFACEREQQQLLGSRWPVICAPATSERCRPRAIQSVLSAALPHGSRCATDFASSKLATQPRRESCPGATLFHLTTSDCW